jgi:type 1 glutamine amidotransferase
VIVHFACGAFQDWPEFRSLAGRAWDPKKRGHDPRGRFRVDITDVDHPVTRGMKPFEADDELYTCVVGERPIEVLATARSKVDKKVYPMAFALSYGRGRVFHCLLGHDVRAFKAPGVLELFRRGTAWAAGAPPVPSGR